MIELGSLDPQLLIEMKILFRLKLLKAIFKDSLPKL